MAAPADLPFNLIKMFLTTPFLQGAVGLEHGYYVFRWDVLRQAVAGGKAPLQGAVGLEHGYYVFRWDILRKAVA
ncbi:MAG: hypothetical protein FWH01_12035 [Oscillospiraceae bacterium]|nr:hypothetical protein [Oscillospiraceae bacterium]